MGGTDMARNLRTGAVAAAVAPLLALALPVSASGEPLRVCASIPPQAHLIERVGGDRVTVSVLIEPGQSPHTFEPTPGLVAEFSGSDVCFSIGLPFEDRVVEDLRAANPDMVVIDSSEGVERLASREADGRDEVDGTLGADRDHEHHDRGQGHHDRGNSEGDRGNDEGGHGNDEGGHGNDEGGHEDDEGAHAHRGDIDPHIWLSPAAAITIAANIRDGLADLDPARSDEYERNFASLEDELVALDSEIAATLEPYQGESFYVFHAAYGYFADAYGLEQVSIEAGGKEPGPRYLAAIISEARSRGVKTLFVQPQHPAPVAETAAREIGAEVVSIDPLARDYFTMMREIASRIAQALAKRTGGAVPGRDGEGVQQ
ncbi:MAG: ABC transporter substrate-binding protein [Candidatus Eisenbacteria bacterium]|nr:ABC transporter substrate-binding protein [Candidatus Eisenbacteria bacterium]